MNIYEIILLAIIGYGILWVWTHAPQIASDSPWKTFLYLLSFAGVVVFFGYFLISGFDWTFTRFDKDARQSKMLAAVTRAFGLSPQDAGLTGQGTFLSQEGGIQVPGVVSAPQETTGVQIEVAAEPAAAVSVAAPTIYEFAVPVVVTPTTNLLVLEYPDGRFVQTETAGIETKACGVDLRRRDASGNAMYALACPASEGVTFALNQVSLPPDWPQLPVGLLPQPTVSAPKGTGGGEPVTMTPEERGACWLDWANGVDLSSITQEQGPLFLPRGTEWRLKGPGGFLEWGSMWHTKNGERWTLTNQGMGVIDYPINGWVGRSFPGYDDAGVIVVKGMGDVCVR